MNSSTNIESNRGQSSATLSESTRLANEAMAAGDTRAAYGHLKRIARELRDDYQAQTVAGCTAAALGELDEARTWLTRARDLRPSDPDAHHNLGLLNFRSGDYSQASRVFEEGVESGITDSAMFQDLGLSYLKCNKPRKARAALWQALKGDPENKEARDVLLESLRIDGDNKRGRRYVRALRRWSPEDEILDSWDGLFTGGPNRDSELEPEKLTNTLVGQRTGHSTGELPGALTELRQMKVAIFATHDSFVGDISAYLGKSNELKTFKRGSLTEMRDLLDWCDVAWFEWCDALLIQATNHLPKLCPIICRLHSYETFTNMPEQVEWSRVDHLVFVNPSVETLLKQRLPDSLSTSVIYNAVDLKKYQIPVGKKFGKRIASVGYINYKKNPQLLLYCFQKIQQWDPEFEFHIAGEHQDPRIALYMKDMARKMGLNLHFHGWVKDMPAFYRDMDFVISTSLFESFHYSIAEGMACGLTPLVHDWFGSENVYPEESRFLAPDDCLSIVQRISEQSMAERRNTAEVTRQYIQERYALPDQLRAIEETFLQVMNDYSAAESAKTDLGLVSIIIPTYNRADMLPEAISSALNQTYKRCEIIIVDDGSTDNTREVLKRYQDEFGSRIKVIHQGNRGVSAALNTAIRNSSGEYISWLSSDDAYHPEKVWEAIRLLDNDPELGWVYSDFFYMSHDSEVQGRASVDRLNPEEFVERMFEGNPIHGCSVMFRKSNLDVTGFFDEELGGRIGYGADGAMWHKMGHHFKFAFIPKALVYYRLHPGQVSLEVDPANTKDEYRDHMRSYFDSIGVKDSRDGCDSQAEKASQRLQSVAVTENK